MSPYIALVPFGCMLAYSAWTDINARRISNAMSAITLLSGLAWAVASAGWEPALFHLAHVAVALAIGMALFGFGFWGGGDGKFYAAVAAWFSVSDFFRLIFIISLAGLALLLVMFAMRKWHGGKQSIGAVPYGVAIAAGAFLNFYSFHMEAGL